MSQPAVILLVFANDESQPLNELAKEQDSLRTILRNGLRSYVDARERAQFEIIPLAYTTIESLLDELRVYRNRIVVMHFAGHTNSSLWQLNDETVNAKGIAEILRLQQSLRFLFLNGCDNAEQVQLFAQVGVPAVIATSAPINDNKARSFSSRFYENLITDNLQTSLKEAFDLAKAEVSQGNDDEDYRTLVFKHKDHNLKEKWAWALEENKPNATNWSLYDLLHDNCFGLPNLPEDVSLPPRPFKNINYFTQKDAQIFFGRCKEITQAYNTITEHLYETDPVHLLYGNTGAGKSSFLAAGLIPRLEVDGYQTSYYRFNSKTGVKGALTEIFDTNDSDFHKSWIQKETEANKPLVIIIDQMEGLFSSSRIGDQTHIRKAKAELGDLLCAIDKIFQPDNKPRGKMVLSFRKEWLAEVLNAFEEKDIAYSKIIIEPLNAKGIKEAIEGTTRNLALQRRYKLQIKNPESGNLADIIAGDLLKYEQGIAPTLQILLSKMWREVEMQEEPTFTLELYKKLGQKGQLIEHHLREQIKEISKIDVWGEQAYKNGLILDVLYAHTTDLGTAGELTQSEFERCYSHIKYRQLLLEELKKRFLIIDIQSDSINKPNMTRLTHDTLAPLIRDHFKRSILSGQRARRILLNKENDTEYVLGAFDLKMVVDGQFGTSRWTSQEKKLVKRSRKRQSIRKAILVSLAALIVFSGIFSAIQWRSAVKSEEKVVLAKDGVEDLIRMMLFRVQNTLANSDPELASDIYQEIDKHVDHHNGLQLLDAANSRLNGSLLAADLQDIEALQEYEKSFKLIQKISQESPNDIATKEELSMAYQALAIHYKYLSNKPNSNGIERNDYRKKSLAMNTKAYHNYKQLISANVTENQKIDWYFHLYNTGINIVDAHRYIRRSKGEDLRELEKNYDLILREIEKKHRDFQFNGRLYDYQSLMARVSRSMGSALRDNKEYQASISKYEIAVDMLEKAISQRPRDIDLKIRQTLSYHKIANAYEKTKNYRKALTNIELAITNLQGLKRHGGIPKRIEGWLSNNIKLKHKYEMKLKSKG